MDWIIMNSDGTKVETLAHKRFNFCSNRDQKKNCRYNSKLIDLQNYKIQRISTGSKNLDYLLGGGIETGAVTEFFGEPGTGKTQICLTLSVMVSQTVSKGGLDARALYIDTENKFIPERVVSIAQSRGFDPEKATHNILLAKVINSTHQEAILQNANSMIDANNVKLLIVDSIISHYRAEYLGRAKLSERQQRLNKFMHSLVRIAQTRGIAVVITNQITLFGNVVTPTGGHVMSHASTYRVHLKGTPDFRYAIMIDSPYHPKIDVVFKISEEGIGDPKSPCNPSRDQHWFPN
jgi:DNA repair protein RadA